MDVPERNELEKEEVPVESGRRGEQEGEENDNEEVFYKKQVEQKEENERHRKKGNRSEKKAKKKNKKEQKKRKTSKWNKSKSSEKEMSTRDCQCTIRRGKLRCIADALIAGIVLLRR